MTKQIGMWALFYLGFNHSLFAAELTAKNFVFDLPGSWHTKVESDTVVATKTTPKDVKDANRAFVVSVFHPASAVQRDKLTDSMTVYLKDVGGRHSGLTLSKALSTSKTSNGLPLSVVEYLKNTSEFFIGGVVAANTGVALITYEGTGDSKVGRKEFDKIMETLSVK